MKTENIITLGLVAGAAALVYGALKKSGRVSAFVQARPQAAKEVLFSALPGDPGYGWRYWSDGVAIGPNGVYYLNGAPVWKPEGVE